MGRLFYKALQGTVFYYKYVYLDIDQRGKTEKKNHPLKVWGLCINSFIAMSHISELRSYAKLLELKVELPELLNPS